jgi:hypothetical protein
MAQTTLRKQPVRRAKADRTKNPPNEFALAGIRSATHWLPHAYSDGAATAIDYAQNAARRFTSKSRV